MRVLQIKSFNDQSKSAILKAIISLIVLMFCFLNLSAQKGSNIKVKIETGVRWDWDKGKINLNAPFLYVEPKVKTSKNTAIGLRIGAAENSGSIHLSDPNQYYTGIGDPSTIYLFVPTFDYYFIKNNSLPYLGVGVGYYLLTTSRDIIAIGISSDMLEVSVSNQVGFLLRGGFALHKVMIGKVDLSKFSIGLEFNYIPKANIETSNGQLIGTIANSYIALSIGYTFGIGKSSK